MQKRRVYAVVIGVAVVAVIIAFSRQPSYRGRSLEAWLPQQFTHPNSGEAAEALHHFGTNALPYLVKWVSYETPGWKRKLFETVNPLVVKCKLASQLTDERNLVRADGSARALRRLGPAGESAIPELTRLIKNAKGSEGAGRVMYALAGLGTNGLPPLMAVLSDRQAKFRNEAAESIGFMGLNYRRVILLLLDCIGGNPRGTELESRAMVALDTVKLDPARLALVNSQDRITDARRMSSLVLGHVWGTADATRDLIFMLRDTDPERRKIATNALRIIDPHGLDAVQALEEALRDPDWDLRDFATNALREIDPPAPGSF